MPTAVCESRQARGSAREYSPSARSARYAALVLNGERWVRHARAGWLELLADAAAPALQSRVEELFKRALFRGADTAAAHQVRILRSDCSTALDLFAVALPKQATARYTDALS